MAEPSLVESLEVIALGSVAITNAALMHAGGRALSVEQWRVLVVLGETPGPIRISAIARGFDVTLPATSRMVQRIASRGLVSLDPDPRDARATLVRLTPAGLSLRAAVLADRRRQLIEVISSVDLPSQAIELAASLATAFRERLNQPHGN